MNYFDVIILLVLAGFMYLGYLRGFIRDLADLLALVAAISLAVIAYARVGAWLTSIVSMPESFASTAAFFLVWFAVMFVYYAFMTFFYDRVPENIVKSPWNRWLGLLPSLARGAIFVWFTVNIAFLLVVAGPIKQALGGSYFTKYLIQNNAVVSTFITKTFGQAALDATGFITVKPQSSESIQLGFTTTNVKPDPAAAKKMLELVNAERKANDLKELVFDEKLAAVGEAHATDMFARGYFSHNTPEGKTPFDRMDAAGISYMIAGENLALAPTTAEAFTGLMNSPGHKANMLSGDFGRVGIGAVNGGSHGIMFAQEFAN